MEDEEREFIKTSIKVCLEVLIALIYSYYFVSKLPKGRLRFFSLLPIFYLFTFIPQSFFTPTSAGLTGFFLTWLANFKLVLFSFDIGPLSYDLPKRSFFNFIIIAACPIKVKQKGNDKSAPTQKVDKKLPLNLWSKFLIYCLIVVAGIFCNYNQNVHPNVLLGIYCCVLYLNLDIILGICNKVVGSILGMELCPPFDEPYLSTSLQEFWGKRWNLIVSDILRCTIYLPVKLFLENYVGKRWAQLVSLMSAFVVSGLMHELLFFYITRAGPTWEVTCFFLLHGVCVIVEIGLKRTLGLGELHWALAGPLTVGFVMVTGYWLFFPQLLRNEVDVRSLEEVKAISRFLKRILAMS